ncbi:MULTISPECIES: dihydroneopterin aldolase [unclassified Idiomarina]|uniref:dihydroneopterin aldolase n=1 Tax=unclassified Idiomarina TaxID=2614829 RepID=UPI000C8940EA|nr:MULTISPECIES: dihydroneopterin aldolase [unclassified Idiomarina]MAD53767.1 dihydroneopterin aldolase [Idiomarinaceae bacterium]MEC7643576.1 dihydroneopterin aldolase [Pseudomonadota bacterium]NQZ05065.1 dihydroneopterin aldolase [Idiomarina sp.]|tara:strand:+ start:4668 stop:5051 length:384 start_codon:yes stop_codon:yes gene_type:complete
MSQQGLDEVLIEGLEVDAVIGVYDWEQGIQQKLVIDLVLAWDCQRASQSDEINDALDYAAVSQAVERWIQAKPRALIETVAEGIAELLFKDFGVTEVEVKVSKPGAVPTATNVAVKIQRTRVDGPFG